MALTYELGKIADWDEVCNIVAVADDPNNGVKAGDRIQNPVTTSIIFSTIAVGMGSITEENCEQFFARLRTYETLFGAFMWRAEVDGKRPEGVAAFITPEEVIQHIGLRCNVSLETDAVWSKRMMKHALADNGQSFARTRRRLEEAKAEPIAVHKIA